MAKNWRGGAEADIGSTDRGYAGPDPDRARNAFCNSVAARQAAITLADKMNETTKRRQRPDREDRDKEPRPTR